MDNLCPLVDCLQVPLDEEFNRILIYTYTDNPTPSHDPSKDQEKLKEYNIPDEFPLYLHIELWEWWEDTYIKKEMKEELIDKAATKIITERYLRFIIRPGKVLKYLSEGIGDRQSRIWIED